MGKTSDSCKRGLHQILGVFMSACLLLLCLASAGLAQTPPTTYTITDLGTLGNYASVASGINASGQITGYLTLTQYGPLHAFIYTPGANPPMLDLGTLPGGFSSQGSGINASGQVTGWADTSSEDTHAFLYSGGTMTDLGTLNNYLGSSYGWAINDSGSITGESQISYNQYHAFVYNPLTQQLMDIDPTQANLWSRGYGINASGQVTGLFLTTLNTTGPTHAFLYTPGPPVSFLDLGVLPGGGTYSQGFGINAAGQVTGEADTSVSGVYHAFLYDPSTGMQDLDPTSTVGTSAGAAINNLGQIVGVCKDRTSAFLYSPGKGMIDLNTFLPPGSGWVLVGAAAINDSGQITGYGNLNGVQHAFLLSPAVPITQPLSPSGGTASFIFSNNIYNINFQYPAGFVPDSSYSLTVTPIQTSQAGWAQRTPEENPYYETQLAPVSGLGGDGIIYRAVCANAAGSSCPEPPTDLFFTIITSWKGTSGDNPGFLKAPLDSPNNWENVLVSYSSDRTDGGPDPTIAGKSKDGFSDWAAVFGVSGAPPSIDIKTPANGASYAVDQMLNASYLCTGTSTSVVKDCVGTVANGSAIDTSSLGSKTFTVNATMTAGPTAVKTVTYNVVCHYAWFTLNPSTVPLGGRTMVTANLQSCSSISQKVALQFTWTVPAPGSCSSNRTVILTTPAFLLKPQTSFSFSFPLWIPKRICAGTYTVSASTLVGGVVVDTASSSLKVTSK